MFTGLLDDREKPRTLSILQLINHKTPIIVCGSLTVNWSTYAALSSAFLPPCMPPILCLLVTNTKHPHADISADGGRGLGLPLYKKRFLTLTHLERSTLPIQFDFLFTTSLEVKEIFFIKE